MEATSDVYAPLKSLIERYRADVHHLRPPVMGQALGAALAHVGALPSSLQEFYLHHNGASLFRGALRVRMISDLTHASPHDPEVVIFAEGPNPEDRWGYAPVAGTGHHFGRWDGARLEPLHEDFQRWLVAMAKILDENARAAEEQLEARLQVDPTCGLLWLLKGERCLERGDADGALKAFRKATANAPDLALAWQRLGEVLLGIDQQEALSTLLVSLRNTRLPPPYPGAPLLEEDALLRLEGLFPAGDRGWERELRLFLLERVKDVRHPGDGALLEAAALALGRCLIAREERALARELLTTLRDRLQSFHAPPDAWRLTLLLASLDTELGHHDEAEATLRPLRTHPEPAVRGKGLLALARIAHLRQEPWVEEMLQEAWAQTPQLEDRCDAATLLAERGDAAMLAEAERLCGRLGDPIRASKLALLQGDHAWKRKDRDAAIRHWQACKDDPESALRAKVRIADALGGPNAQQLLADAVAGYQALQLPLREAWARLRLGALGDRMQLQAALDTFQSSGMASGVAAVEAALQDPGRFLSWHMNLAAELARQRHDAWRQRPPLVRADADRPERRLLAHRKALAECDTGIVQVLAREILQETRRFQMADGRARDPSAMRFVALVDLLAGHPSYDAAQVMLALLREQFQQETAARALIGALARSPNMTLVEALLRMIQEPCEPLALARAIEVLGWRREREAAPRLRHFAEAGSLPVRRAAITALGRIGDPAAISILLDALDLPELAEGASIALLLLGEWQGVNYHGQALTQNLASSTTISGEIVGRFGGPQYLLLLRSTAEKEGVGALGSLHGLGLLGSVRVVPWLIETVGHRDPRRGLMANVALELITGHSEDFEEPHPRLRWERWWEGHSGQFPEGLRWRAGQPLNVSALIERLGHDDFSIRQSTYDELAISTGQRLPFDADGPWRVQVAHQNQWRRWLHEQGGRVPQSGWLFHGRNVG